MNGRNVLMRRAASWLLMLTLPGCSLVNDEFSFAADAAPMNDAGQSDSGPSDAGSLDGGTDAGARDAGSDAGLDGGPDVRDLAISCSGPESVEQRDDPFTVAWTARNDGSVGIEGADLTIELLQPPMEDGESDTWVEVATDATTATLAPSDDWSDDVTFPTPDWIAFGDNRVRCSVRPASGPADDDPANDREESTFLATGEPDLVVTFVTMLGTADGDVAYSATIENQGLTAARNVTWRLRGQGGARVTTLDDGSFIYVGRGAARDNMDAVSYCSGGCLSGSGELIFEIDWTDEVREGNESNNEESSAPFTW